MNRPTRILIAVGCAALMGCGADLDFKQAVHLHESGQKMRAVRAYDEFIEKYPDDERVPEVSLRAGRLYGEVLGRCEEAAEHFERAARGGDPWAGPAKLGLMNCPDFFPLRPGSRWTYVDSESGGEFMRLEIAVKTSSGNVTGEITGTFYAGETRYRDYRRTYEKKGWSVWESEGETRAPVLRYPYRKGRAWKVERGEQTVRYSVVAHDAVVKTKAGRFTGCVKVKAHTKGFQSWTYEYFCPNVGRVKTTVGVAGAENPNTELAKHHIP